MGSSETQMVSQNKFLDIILSKNSLSSMSVSSVIWAYIMYSVNMCQVEPDVINNFLFSVHLFVQFTR